MARKTVDTEITKQDRHEVLRKLLRDHKRGKVSETTIVNYVDKMLERFLQRGFKIGVKARGY